MKKRVGILNLMLRAGILSIWYNNLLQSIQLRQTTNQILSLSNETKVFVRYVFRKHLVDKLWKICTTIYFFVMNTNSNIRETWSAKLVFPDHFDDLLDSEQLGNAPNDPNNEKLTTLFCLMLRTWAVKIGKHQISIYGLCCHPMWSDDILWHQLNRWILSIVVILLILEWLYRYSF